VEIMIPTKEGMTQSKFLGIKK